MSDEKQEVTSQEVVNDNLGTQEVPVAAVPEALPEQPAPESKQLNLQYGFVCGVNADGGVVLDMVGEKRGLIEMLGLCKYAEYHLQYTLDAASGQGTPVISQQVQQLGEMMKVLINLVAQRKQAVESIQKSQDSRIITP